MSRLDRADRRTGAVVALVALAVSCVLVRPPAADADPATVTVTKVGWWTDRLAANEAGEGAFEVSAGPDGTVQGVAAFEVAIDADSVGSASIVLGEVAALAEFSSLALCPTTEDWEPADPGPLDDAPAADCSTRVNLTRTVDSGTWIGDITTMLADGGTVSLLVAPEYAPPTPLGTGMLVRVDSIEITAETGVAPPSDTTTTTVGFDTPGGGGTFEPPSDPGFSVDYGSPTPSPGVDLPPVPAPVDDLGSTPPPDAPDDAGGDDEEFFTLGPIESSSEPPRPWIRLLLLVPLSAATGVGAAYGRRWVESRSDVVLT